MAYEHAIQPTIGTLLAGEILTGEQYHLVYIDAANGVKHATAATDRICGVLRNAPKKGEPCEIVDHGIAKVKASAVIVAGAVLTSDGDGKAVTTTTAAHYIIGQALEAAAAEDVIISVYLTPTRKHS